MPLATLDQIQMLLSTTGDAELLQMLLDSADAAIRSYLRRGVGRTAFTSWPESGADTVFLTGSGTRELILPFRPVSAVASVYEDLAGYWGQASGAFASSTLLTAGVHYAMWLDDGDQSSSGTLVRLAGPAAGGASGEYGWFPPTWDAGVSRRGTLAAGRRGPVWPARDGCLKITFTAGFAAVPADLSQAVLQLAALMKKTAPHGGLPASSESLGRYSYSLATNLLGGSENMAATRNLLKRYRELAL